jgi:hypothetical protein
MRPIRKIIEVYPYSVWVNIGYSPFYSFNFPSLTLSDVHVNCCITPIVASYSPIPNPFAIHWTYFRICFLTLNSLGSTILDFCNQQNILNKIDNSLFAEPKSTSVFRYFTQPFGNKETCIKELSEANFERLAHLIKVCGFLLQT